MIENRLPKGLAALLTVEATILVVTASKWIPVFIRVCESVINWRFNVNVGLGI